MSIDFSELQNEIVADLTNELSGEDTFNADILTIKVKLAIKDVISRRNYSASGLTDEDILADLENYYAVITNVARYDYNQIGIEGEVSHSENGVSRSYSKRDSLFNGVYAFVGVIS